jgi:glycine/D-amino acid oxidase-like deaminating enzyme
VHLDLPGVDTSARPVVMGPGDRYLLAFPPHRVANGLGASGLTMGPYVGADAADLACGDTLPLDVTRYDPARFGGG